MEPEQRRDRRVARTERALSDALFAIIQHKSYDKVTVQDIVERANVGRSTFYSHFDTKDDLLVARVHDLTEDLDIFMAEATGEDGPVLPSLGLMRHVRAQEPLFRALFGSSGIELVTREARSMLEARALATIQEREARGVQHASPAHLRAAFLAGSLMAIVQWWLDHGLKESPEEIDRVFQASVAGA